MNRAASALHRKPSSYVTPQFPNVITMWKKYMIAVKLHFRILISRGICLVNTVLHNRKEFTATFHYLIRSVHWIEN
jgi:hypothetical protein